MPHADGTPTVNEHTAKARAYLEGAFMTPQEPGTDVVCALAGIGQALLALVDLMEARRAEGRGW